MNNEYYEENFTRNFEKAFERHYHKPISRNRQLFVNDYDEKYPELDENGEPTGKSIKFSVDTWFSKRGKNAPDKIQTIYQICDILDCDIEFFLTSQESISKDIAYASEITGLTEITIDQIKDLSAPQKIIVDALFSRSAGATHLIETLQEMIFYSNPRYKNQTTISLDKDITRRDKKVENLEKELNQNEVIEILSHRLGTKMNSIITSLNEDRKLADEISADYEAKYFKLHKQLLTVSELPKLGAPEPIENKIFKMEQKILDRLDRRECIGNQFNYSIEWLNTSTDFSHKIQDLRLAMPPEQYLEWLQDINKKTE
jgi:hypothetical protein